MSSTAMPSDKDLYQIIADELAARNTDPALWTQALAAAEGDADKTQANYIRLRFADLKRASAAALGIPGAKPVDDGVLRMRAELKRKINTLGISNLYGTLGVQPDASDAVIAAAIADLEAQGRADSAVTRVEFRAARQTLGDPATREQYDRKLLDSILDDARVQVRPAHAYEPADGAWWASGKASVLVGVISVAVLGYLGLGFFKERGNHEVQKSAVEVQRDAVGVAREAVQSGADVEKQRIAADAEARARALSLAEEQQRRQADFQAQAMERQRQMDQQRLAQQQAQREYQRVQREKLYWACLNQQLGGRDVSSYDASARCAGYR